MQDLGRILPHSRVEGFLAGFGEYMNVRPPNLYSSEVHRRVVYGSVYLLHLPIIRFASARGRR